MYFTYILQSIKYTDKYYYGYTKDIYKRLEQHNKGESYHTSKFCPWKLIFYAVFETKKLAEYFEKYLKTASGRAFVRKRLIKV